MKRRARFVWVAGVALAFAGVMAVAIGGQQEDRFPHEEHGGLFPLCTGCHGGVETGDAADFYPEPELCARCHDGVQQERVTWEGPERLPSNVVFDHTTHAAELAAAGDPMQSCVSCHSESPEVRMSVTGRERLETCWGCHAHATDDHFRTENACERCHVPLARSGFPLARIEALPIPSTHEQPGFIAEGHGALAPGRSDRCATCHTVERCAACHVDAERVEIQAIPAAPPGMELPEMSAEYPVPDSHVDEGWLDAHRLQVPVRECNTCHVEDDCRSCHVGIVPEMVEALPRRSEVAAPGVGLVARAPESHASPFFLEAAHAPLAAADGQSCATCHTESFCVDCHDGPPGGGYHPPSFVSRHAAQAFGRADECASCHSTAVFCRACHEQSGFDTRGRLDEGYHDAEPVWLLRHGQAARQSLESCASCHRQTDCVQCHGVLGSFSVSPHTRDFDAEAAWARSPRTCMACHIRNPLGGRP